MWRPARGATSRPESCRPTSGYGRHLGRPGPRSDDSFFYELVADEPSVSPLDPSQFGVRAVEQDAEMPAPAPAPAPVTP